MSPTTHIHPHGEHSHDDRYDAPKTLPGSVLGWPAWQRALLVLPLLVLLWLAVAWASAEGL